MAGLGVIAGLILRYLGTFAAGGSAPTVRAGASGRRHSAEDDSKKARYTPTSAEGPAVAFAHTAPERPPSSGSASTSTGRATKFRQNVKGKKCLG